MHPRCQNPAVEILQIVGCMKRRGSVLSGSTINLRESTNYYIFKSKSFPFSGSFDHELLALWEYRATTFPELPFLAGVASGGGSACPPNWGHAHINSTTPSRRCGTCGSVGTSAIGSVPCIRTFRIVPLYADSLLNQNLAEDSGVVIN